MTRRVLVFSIALSSIACGATEVRLIAPFPDDAAYVAALWLDADDRPIAGSGLLTPERAARHVVLEVDVDDAARLALVAWTEAELATVGRPDDETLAAAPLTAAGASDARLPPPGWVGVSPAGDGLVMPERVELDLALTARWLIPCPTVLMPGEVHDADVRCLVRPCGDRPVQSGCSLTVDLTGCGQGYFELELDGSGGFSPKSQDAATCRPTSAVEPARFSVDCNRCRIDLYSTPLGAPPFVTVETFELVSPGPPEPLERFPIGVVADVAVLGNQVVAGTVTGVPSEDECFDGPRESALHWFDVDTAAPVRTTTVAGCIRLITKDPSGDGAIFVSFEPTTTLVRVDGEGREIGRLPLDGLRQAPRREPHAMVTIDDPPRIALLAETYGGHPAHLLFVTLDPFEVRATYEMREPDGHALAFIEPFLVVGQDGRLELWDPERETFQAQLLLGTGEGIANDPDVIVPVPAASRLVGLNLASLGGVHTTTLVDGNVAAARYYLSHGIPTAGAAIEGTDFVLAGVTDVDAGGDATAGLVRFDATNARFLPPRVDVGRGPMRGIARARDGAYWGVLVQSGHLFRAVLP